MTNDRTLTADLDHVAVAVERWADVTPRYGGDLAGVFLAGGRAFGFAPIQLKYPHAERAMKVEILEPNDVEQNDFLRRFLDRNGPGPHHLTFKVPDLVAALDVIRAGGYEPIGVFLDFDDWKESFIHPKQACGIVVQIAQAAGEMPDSVGSVLPPPRVDRPASLVAVELLVPDLALGLALFEGLLGGARAEAESAEDDGVVVLDWPGGGRVRLVRPAPGTEAAAWLGDLTGRLHHLRFEVDEPGEVAGAAPLGDGTFVVPPEANQGTRLVLVPRS